MSKPAWTVGRVARPDPPDAEVQLVGGFSHRPPAHSVGPAGLGAADIGDRVMAELGEVFDRAPGPAWVVGDDARHLGDPAVEDDHRLLLGQHPDRVVRHARAGEQNAVDGGHLSLGPGAFQLGVLLGVRQQDRVARGTGRLVGATDQLGVERVRDVGDDEGQAAGPAAGEAGEGVRAVADLGGGREHALGGLGADATWTCERPGDRRGRYPRRPSDVVDGRLLLHSRHARCGGNSWQSIEGLGRPLAQWDERAARTLSGRGPDRVGLPLP